MQKQFFGLLCLIATTLVSAQIKGKVTDQNNQPLPFVNILIENTYKGTTSNDDGFYELNITTPKTYTLVFSYLGYKTVKKEVQISQFPYELDMVLIEESVSLNEVLIDSETDPANAIIRQTIAQREANLAKIESFKADFYSRGLLKIVDAPEKIMGQELGDLGGGLDSTRSGIVYLSETISKIQFLNPNKLKEKITASKVSGDSNGFSFNSALDVDYNFYNNTISLGNEIISPIANNAFSYYNYKLEGMFYNERGQLINKIKVIPKRKNDPVFSGFIYIVEEQWTLFAIELSLTGTQAKIPIVDQLSLQQSFSYSENHELWALISQSIDLKYALFGIKGEGRFTAVYSNYEFNIGLSNKDFTREIVTYEKEANTKDSIFWNSIRPVPLTAEERTDYTKKDSLQVLRESQPYLDSVDRVKNKFKVSNILGYTYQNSIKDYRLGFNIPTLKAVQFNTVQGYTANADVFYTKKYDAYNRYFNIDGSLQYGFSDKRFRASASMIYKFNSITNSFLVLSGGVSAEQFSPSTPITPLINTVSTLFFEDNYMKLYDKSYLAINYAEELFNGFRIYAGLSYERRKAIFNTTDQTLFNDDDDVYTSNNPLDALALGTAPFNTHHTLKGNLDARINFGQKYLSYPDAKYNVNNEDYPTLYLGYETSFAASDQDYNYHQIKASLRQAFNIKDKGRFHYNLKAGKFFNADNIAFMDYQHFNGNQTHVSTSGNYTNVFNNVDYYTASTNDAYFEGHIEHDFNGYILGKLPLLNNLNFNLVLGMHVLAQPNFSPYQEYSVGVDNIGWGKWKFLRVDYLRSYQSGFQSDAVVFGLKFF